MSKQTVYFIVGFNINEGKLEAFKQIASAMVAATQEEPGALAYEWHFSADHKRCRLLETYADAAAMQQHISGKAVQLIPKLLEVSSVSGFDVYGDPGSDSAATLTAFGAEIFPRWSGLAR
jgi:quinol monooxygenase YgiN